MKRLACLALLGLLLVQVAPTVESSRESLWTSDFSFVQ
ncbi:hypothetical protein NP493_376g03030 [Ridgeia piscesae]|uniref:Uncharacterized protein n=1 Tax=Ridgeia piscesae TaxID=27915 RepID=A0AAD9NTM0_RIDPI|nr:hypothetical protein NP493_376g03030 [Ridgeia piscesae]